MLRPLRVSARRPRAASRRERTSRWRVPPYLASAFRWGASCCSRTLNSDFLPKSRRRRTAARSRFASPTRSAAFTTILGEPRDKPVPQDAMLGKVVMGRYRVVAPLARGGMGIVYLGRLEGAAGF